jgi:hypothetical protein
MAPQYNMDVAFRKSIDISEGNRLSLRVEAINITNTAKFQAPESRYDNSAFGRITAQAGFSRTFQWMIRWEH